MTITQRNELIELLKKPEELLNGTLGTQKIDPVDFKLKEDMKPIQFIPYPVPKVHEEMFKNEV